MSDDKRNRPLQEGMRPEGKAMRPMAVKNPPSPPPKPTDSFAAKPPSAK